MRARVCWAGTRAWPAVPPAQGLRGCGPLEGSLLSPAPDERADTQPDLMADVSMQREDCSAGQVVWHLLHASAVRDVMGAKLRAQLLPILQLASALFTLRASSS